MDLALGFRVLVLRRAKPFDLESHQPIGRRMDCGSLATRVVRDPTHRIAMGETEAVDRSFLNRHVTLAKPSSTSLAIELRIHCLLDARSLRTRANFPRPRFRSQIA